MATAVAETQETWSTYGRLTHKDITLPNGTRPILVYATPRALHCLTSWTPGVVVARNAKEAGLLLPTREIARVLEQELPFSSDEKFYLLFEEHGKIIMQKLCRYKGKYRLQDLSPDEVNMTGVPNLHVPYIFLIGIE